MPNDLLTALNALTAVFSLSALVVSLVALKRADTARLVPKDARELIREMEDVLEKLPARQAREGMRKIRAVRREAEPEQQLEDDDSSSSSSSSADPKAELWAIARRFGFKTLRS